MKRIFLLIILSSCSLEEPFNERPYPKVETISAVHFGSSVTFNAKVTYKPELIISHGFRWTKNGDPINGVYASISFGSLIEKSYSHTIVAPKKRNEYDYFVVRAYIESSEYTFYGKPLFY